MADDGPLVSKLNLTWNQNQEIRNTLNECNRLRRNGDMAKWRWTQDILKAELAYDIKILDKSTKFMKDPYAPKLIAVEKKIDAIMPQFRNPKFRKQLYDLLDEREIILRDAQEAAGKGSKRVFEDDDDDE